MKTCTVIVSRYGETTTYPNITYYNFPSVNMPVIALFDANKRLVAAVRFDEFKIEYPIVTELPYAVGDKLVSHFERYIIEGIYRREDGEYLYQIDNNLGDGNLYTENELREFGYRKIVEITTNVAN